MDCSSIPPGSTEHTGAASSLLLVTGPPGAGKSTVARVLAARFERSALVEGDAFFRFVATGAIPPWRAEAHEQNTVVTRAAAVATGAFVTGGFVTVYDGVVGPRFLPTFAASTGLDSLHDVILLPSAERCVERVVARPTTAFATNAPQGHVRSVRACDDRRSTLDTCWPIRPTRPTRSPT
jgi:energy-coupling factor transporter ATP-binding protein EcfA2